MERSYLEKLYFKKKNTESLKKYKKHKNFCSRLYKKESKKYFHTLDFNKITDNKAFCKNIHPLFSEKRKFANKITLVDSEENILSDDTFDTVNHSVLIKKLQMYGTRVVNHRWFFKYLQIESSIFR